MTMLVGAFVAGVILMATGFLSDWNERRVPRVVDPDDPRRYGF